MEITIYDICRVYMVDQYNIPYIEKFEYSFDALYELSWFIRKTMGMRVLRLVPYIPYSMNQYNIAGLEVLIPVNEFMDINDELEKFDLCCKHFCENDLVKTRDVFIDLVCKDSNERSDV